VTHADNLRMLDLFFDKLWPIGFLFSCASHSLGHKRRVAQPKSSPKNRETW